MQPSLIVAALAGAASLSGQDPGDQRVSGPEAGRSLPAIRAYAAAGEQAGKEIDLAGQLRKGDGALLFVHELSRNTAPVIRGLDQIARERSLLGFRYVPILLHDDRTAGENRLKAVNGSLRMANPIVLSLDGVEGPGELALNRKCTLTLILTKDGKVARSVGLTDTGPNDEPRIRKWVAELNGALPASVGEWGERLASRLPEGSAELRAMLIRSLLDNQKLQDRVRGLETRLRQAQRGQRRGANRGRNSMRRNPRMNPERAARGTESRPNREAERRPPAGKVPADEVLQGLIRPYINKLATAEKVDDLFLEITTHVNGKADLERQARDMFRLILSRSYGTDHARKLAERYVRDHERKNRK